MISEFFTLLSWRVGYTYLIWMNGKVFALKRFEWGGWWIYPNSHFENNFNTLLLLQSIFVKFGKLFFADIWCKSFKLVPQLTHCKLTCLKISSSSRRRRSSTCLLPLSSASLILLWRSASMEKAWILLSSCRRTSSLLRKSIVSANEEPSNWLIASSTNNSCRVVLLLK